MFDFLKSNSFFDYIGAAFLMMTFFAGVYMYSRIISTPPAAVKDIQKVVATCSGEQLEYNELVKKGKAVILVKNSRMHALDGKFVGSKKVIARRGGTIACGYLFVRAKKDGGMLNSKYESIYVNPQGLGGHLLLARSLPTIEEKDFSIGFFSLSAVPYLPTTPFNANAQNFEVSDWSTLLNVNNKIEFWIGLSTLSKSAVMHEVVLAYKCLNKETREETDDCQLSIE